MANKFRESQPQRTCAKNYKGYRSFKPHLASDFNYRCGYTDCSDFWFGGQDCFHIDHFIPWKNYPAQPNLKTDYSNLVYSCSYVNILKSNDEGDYIDPCTVDYNLHFTRDNNGNIQPIPGSAPAKHMYKKLKLYMSRYQIIWMLDRLLTTMDKLKELIDTTPDLEDKNDHLIIQGELANYLLGYINSLKKKAV